MGRFENTNVQWPPHGWAQFAAVKGSSGQSVAKNIGKARIFGLQYNVESMPLSQGERKFFRHDIMIDGWEYSILNESMEYPVLSFSIVDYADPALPKDRFLTDICSYDTPIPHTGRSASRAVSAALFLIKQIAQGSVPDVNRVLRIYRIHPAQAFLYKGDVQADLLKHAFAKGGGLPKNAAKL